MITPADRRIRRLNRALVAVIVLFAMAAAYTSFTILERQQALKRATRYDVAFSASQAGIELARLTQRVTAIGSRSADVAVDEVELRFAILLNRLSLMQNGEFREFVAESAEREALLEDFEERWKPRSR